MKVVIVLIIIATINLIIYGINESCQDLDDLFDYEENLEEDEKNS